MSQAAQLAAAPLSSFVSFRNVQPDTVRASFPLCFPDQLQKDSDGRIDLDDPANQKILESSAAADGANWLTAQGFKHFAQKQYRRELSALNQAKAIVVDDDDDAKVHPVKRRTSFSKAHGQCEAEEKGSDPDEATPSKPAFVLASARANNEGGASLMMASAQNPGQQPVLEKRVYVHPVLASEAPGLALALSEAGALTGIGNGNDLKLELEAQVVHKGGKCLLQFTIPVLGTYSKEMPFFLPEGKVMLRGELITIFYIPTGARLSVWLNGQQVWDFKIGL